MDLSIIIPSFKRADLLEFGLRSLCSQLILSQYEIIVLNDGVEDETRKVCDSYKDKLNIRYVFTGHRNTPEPVWRIPGFAINIGVKLAQGQFLIIMCPEMYLMEDCVQPMVDMLKGNPKQIVITDGKDDQSGEFLGKVRMKEDPRRLLSMYSAMPELNTKFPFFLGIAAKEAVDIGGYDEDFIGNCWDDQDFIMRLQQNGCFYTKVGFKIVHLYHSRLRYDAAKIKAMWDYNKDVYDRKFGTVKRNVNKNWGSLLTAIESRPPTKLEQHFTAIYEKNIWSGKESRSGTGSDLAHTKEMRPELVKMINSLGISTMLDLPCGDFNWMKEILTELAITSYIGADIVKAMLRDNEIKYSGMPIVAAPKFVYLNAIEDIPPKTDLILCRDGLVHLSFKTIMRVLKNFLASGSTYLIMTTFTRADRAYPDIEDGGWHPLNFQLPPFNFPPPYKLISENCVECGGIYADKALGLWKLAELRKILEPIPDLPPAPGEEEREKLMSIRLPSGKVALVNVPIESQSVEAAPSTPQSIVIPNKKSRMRVAHIHPWWDSAGVGILHAKMMNRYTNIEVRHIVAGNTCLNHETDLILAQHDDEIKNVLERSDILHFNTFWYDDPQLIYKFPWERYTKGKRLIFHMHGGSICFNYKKLEEISKIATMVTCSPLIPKFMKFAAWVPNILPIDEPLYLPKTRESILPVKFLLMVNHDHNKGRAEIEWLFHKLNSVYEFSIPFESWLHKHQYVESLKKRQAFDVVIDNITQGFIGMVGWEAMSQAQVCMARLSPIVLENYTRLGNGDAPPIVNVSGIDELAKWIVDLSTDVALVRDFQKRGRAWMDKYYNPKRLSQLWEKRYLEIYRNGKTI